MRTWTRPKPEINDIEKRIEIRGRLSLTPRLLLLLGGEPAVLPNWGLGCGERRARLHHLNERIGRGHAKRLLLLWHVPSRLHLHLHLLLLLLHRVERVPSRIRGELLEALHLPGVSRR